MNCVLFCDVTLRVEQPRLALSCAVVVTEQQKMESAEDLSMQYTAITCIVNIA